MAAQGANFHTLEDLDEATASLILELQIQDTEALLANANDTNKSASLSDGELAIALYREEVQNRSTVLADHNMSHSLREAIVVDNDLVAQFAAEGNMNTGNEAIRDNNLHQLRQEDYVTARTFHLHMGDIPSNSGALTQFQSARFECAICLESKPIFKVLRLSCEHHQCDECLQSLFRLCLTDEQSFPPRCCRREITLATARIYLDTELVEQFQAKSIEYATNDRTYCPRTVCASFIPPGHFTGDIATCPRCGVRTCTVCKGKSHHGDCPQDVALQQLLDLAQRERWQRCYRCKRVVDIISGCNHMSCPCGAEFCYECAARWKTCACPWWDERHLLEQADRNAIREEEEEDEEVPAVARAEVRPANQRPQLAINHDERVRREIEILRHNHECAHQQWRFIRRQHQCEHCTRVMPDFVWECQQCRIRVCNRCKHNLRGY